jgi:serine protease Do
MTLNDANRAQRVEVHDFGLRLEALTDSLRTKYNVEADSNGVLVTDIQPGTAGAESDLERGDLIVEVQRTPVRTIDDVRARLEDLRKQNRPYALILVHKQGDARWATLRLSNVP